MFAILIIFNNFNVPMYCVVKIILNNKLCRNLI